MTLLAKATSFLLFLIFWLALPIKIFAFSWQQQASIQVSATIGERRLTLSGWTSPYAKVVLAAGNALKEETWANQKGEFLFDAILLPNKLPDLYLYTQDQSGNPSPPLSLPSPPLKKHTVIREVLMPPTLNLEKGNFRPGELIKAQGFTFPQAEVEINFFKEHDFSLLPKVLAYELPKYKIKSDKNGRFEFNLPAQAPTTMRIFATSRYHQSPSPKSNTLTFHILSWIALVKNYLWRLLKLFWQVFRNYWCLITLEIALIIFLVKKANQTSPLQSEANADPQLKHQSEIGPISANKHQKEPFLKSLSPVEPAQKVNRSPN